jgi:general secretion pathway protein A
MQAMYAPHFGLRQEAFSIAPDPRFLHLSATHREALAHLLYGLQGGGGFVLLTGDIGTGKTTVCRAFLEQMPHDHRVAYVVNPEQTPPELLQTVCQEFGIALPDPPPATLKPYVDALNQFLLDCHARGLQCLLVVDEAQALSARLLELLRLLTNLETSDRKLLQIMLIGQPELRDKLAQPELEQLSQRVIARVHLGPLGAADTALYVQHRLAVAGLAGESPFDARALQAVYRLSGGVPRRINLLCQRALLGAYGQGVRRVTPALLKQAAAEVFGARDAAGSRRRPWLAAGVALGLGAAAVAGVLLLRPVATAVPALAALAPASAVKLPSASAPAATALQPLDDERAAAAALAALWSLPLAEGVDLCTAAAAQDLACHRGDADPALLKRLDRPALLTLPGRGAVLLLALGSTQARVQGAGGEQTVPRADLEAAWGQGFTTLWRPPPGWGQAGGRVQGEVADWVLQQLTALQGPSRRLPRDDALRQRVFAFQVSQGLALDGVAGPVTLMLLNRAAGIDEPRLRPEP